MFKLVASQKLVSVGKKMSNLAMTLGLPIRGVVKKTVYDQFVGGETISECEKTIAELREHGVSAILDYSVEGKKTEAAFESCFHKTLETIDFGAKNGGVPFAVFKVTGLARFGLLEKISSGKVLTKEENEEFIRAKNRVEKICEKGAETGIGILVDAEESWIQNAIDELAREMMREFNKKEAIVFNTMQMYRHDRLNYLKNLYDVLIEENLYGGVKLVRGAYMEKERERAEEMGYLDPIQPNKAATDRDYDLAIEFVLQHLDRISLVAGSHNEESAQKLAQMMKENNISKNDKRIWFSQLYGMSDNLSFNLAKEGYQVVKYLPFGPVKETLPYLIRRAEENTSAAGQTNRELILIEKEMRRRGID